MYLIEGDLMVSKFEKYVSELIDYSKASQENEEYVEHKNALKAYYYITHIKPTQIGDLLLYCSSLSLINRYVKQEDSILINKNKYSFKSNGLIRLMRFLQNKNKINGFEMMFEIDKDKGNSTILYTSVYGMHFCFHSVSKKLKEMIPKPYEAQFEWDGIKKTKMC